MKEICIVGIVWFLALLLCSLPIAISTDIEYRKKLAIDNAGEAAVQQTINDKELKNALR